MKRPSFVMIQLVFVLWLMSFSLVQAAAPIRLSFAGGSVGATWYSLGSGFVKVIQTYCPDITMTLEAGGGTKNLRLIAQNPNVIGFTNVDLAYDAVIGRGDFKTKLPLQALMAGHASQIYIITNQNSGINKFEDLRGKAVAVGSPGSGTATASQMVLNPLGITNKDIKPKLLSTGDACDGIKDRVLDAAVIFSGTPIPSITELSITHKIKFIPITQDMAKKIQEHYPYINPVQIPAGTYKGQSAPIETVEWDSYLMANTGLPLDVGYRIVKALFEHTQELGSGSVWES